MRVAAGCLSERTTYDPGVIRRLRGVPVVAAVAVLALLTSISPAYAGGRSSKSGDLAGNLPGPVYLLIPLALGLALLTVVVLGSLGEPKAGLRRSGGVSRVLSEREPSDRSS
jgi:hypothetical protein